MESRTRRRAEPEGAGRKDGRALKRRETQESPPRAPHAIVRGAAWGNHARPARPDEACDRPAPRRWSAAAVRGCCLLDGWARLLHRAGWRIAQSGANPHDSKMALLRRGGAVPPIRNERHGVRADQALIHEAALYGISILDVVDH